MVKRFIAGVLLLFSLGFLQAEVDMDMSLSGLLTLTKNEDILNSSGLAKGQLTLKSKGGSNVKSQITLDIISMRNMGTLSIAKAWVKFRYPLFRATLGKNRITWGEGAAFNAGDVIFDDYISPDGSGEVLDMTADELKSLNRTLALVTFPMGRFTYAEAIYLPYDFFSTAELGGIMMGTPPEEKKVQENSFGGRFVTKAAGMKWEGGYIYNGMAEVHKPYVSTNGTLGLDYHLSASARIPYHQADFESWKESVKLSWGGFYLFELEEDRTLTLRLEAMVKPWAVWEGAVTSSDAGLMFYPEIAFVPNEELSFFFRSLVSPLDLSASSTLGLNWKTYQGFSIGSFLTVNAGEEGDIYSFKDAHSFTVAVTHKF